MTPQRLARLSRYLGHAFGSLKLRMTAAGVVALALGVFLTTLVLVQRAERDTLAEQRQRELGETARTAAVLGSRVVALQKALQTVATQFDERTLHDPAALERFITDRAVLRDMFGNVFAAAPDGRVRVFATRHGVQPRNFSVADRPYFRQTLQEDRPIISQAMPSRAVPEPVIVLTYPLRGARGVYGVIGGALWLASGDLMAHVLQYREDSKGVLLVVTDMQGRILAHPDGSRVMQPLSSEPRLAAAWAEWGRMRSPLEPAGLSLELPSRVVSVAAVSGPQWLVWRALPESQVLAPLYGARHHALQWAAVMVGVTSLVLLALVSWQLRPLRALKRRAQHLFDPGHDPQAGWPAAGGEIGQLASVLCRVSIERSQLEAAHAELLRRLESVMAAAPVGIAFVRHGRFELVNVEFGRLFGRAPHELTGQPVAAIGLDESTRRRLQRHAYRAVQAGRTWRGEWELQRGDGSRFWAALRACAADPAEPAQGLIWSVADINDQVTARQQLQWAAHHDRLTGLANRAGFEQRLAQVFALRPKSLPAALVAIDLDQFKPLNDRAGHAAGDAMLEAVATALRGCVRASDLAARLGGDEFVLLLEHCPAERAMSIAEAVCNAVAGIALPWEGQLLQVGASAGVAMLQSSMDEPAHWLRAADRACYDAKRAGRGQVRAASPWVPLHRTG